MNRATMLIKIQYVTTSKCIVLSLDFKNKHAQNYRIENNMELYLAETF